MQLLRVGNKVINLANVLNVTLRWPCDGEEEEDDVGRWTGVLIAFALRGSDELEDGTGWSRPYEWLLEGEEAAAFRAHLEKRLPDLCEGEDAR